MTSSVVSNKNNNWMKSQITDVISEEHTASLNETNDNLQANERLSSFKNPKN